MTISIQQRSELHRQIWQIANEVRGAVDGWDFKQYVLGTLFYRFISEKFEKYNDCAFEIIGYLADWGRCSSGIFHNFDYHRQKTAEEFKECVMRVLTKNYEENPDVRTKMTVAEIEKEFLTRL
ncbi:type I restriction-modification system subunit M N-terminal domain-containing protein [Histophilus somni]|uniref:type I restriction-modification system subunit M N-terminal domain-containing protein n=1 Tax=Histophilus somni TaxID=731 RepID=UPI00201EE37B|nr:type I restriction-modification system subunit M N-terminal domain-containing protein [Histophilus somni]